MKLAKGIILAIVYILILIAFIHTTSFIFTIVTQYFNMIDTIEFFASANGDYTTIKQMQINAGQQFSRLATIIVVIIYFIYDQHKRRSK